MHKKGAGCTRSTVYRGLYGQSRLNDTFGPYGEPQARVDPGASGPTAIAEVEFVQFVDGTIWGDRAAGKDLLQERSLALDKLKFLSDTYRMKGEQQFVSELKNPSELVAILNLQRLYSSNKGNATAVIDKITGMLEQANQHLHAFRSATTSAMGRRSVRQQ
jgi:hypothetical protein